MHKGRLYDVTHCSVCLVSVYKGVARGGPGVPVIPIGRPSFEQTTYNIQVAKTP